MNRITIAKGDGIGPEIMESALKVLDAAGAGLEYDEISIGESVYNAGHSTGITPDAWDTLIKNKIFFKAPITTPQGGGVKSLNVTVRKTLGLFANVRPCISYPPFIRTHFPGVNLVIVRENEEDLYAGIEHQQTPDVCQTLKLISVPGTEKIIRYAFEYAKQHNRQKVTCITKDNIMKISDGLFHRIFNEVSIEYPDIEANHMIVDIGMAKMAVRPDMFDVVVLPNLYGDIMSDVAAEITGSVGIGGSANIGKEYAMFEAIHGSAPDIAGKGIANPSGLILASVIMLNHMGKGDIASKIHNAWLRTIEDNVHTADIFQEGHSRKASTSEFTDALIERLGKEPKTLPIMHYPPKTPPINIDLKTALPIKKELVGIDVFIDFDGKADDLGEQLSKANTSKLQLSIMTNRGVKVWPDGFDATFCTRHWRCRFKSNVGVIHNSDVIELLTNIEKTGLDFIKTEHLYQFDGKIAYSLAQGE